MNKANGGSAFPTVEANYHNENTRGDGLSIRDYFAAKAMQGILSSPSDPASFEAVGVFAYKVAAETAEHLARLVRCHRQQRLLLNAAQCARARATGEMR